MHVPHAPVFRTRKVCDLMYSSVNKYFMVIIIIIATIVITIYMYIIIKTIITIIIDHNYYNCGEK